MPLAVRVPELATQMSDREPLQLHPVSAHRQASSQGSLADSLGQRNSWALTDQSHGAVTTESHPSKRPLLGRSQSSWVGTDQRMSQVPPSDELGVRRRHTKPSSWDEDAHRRRRQSQWFKVILELVLAAWATYTTVRYFIGYTLYTSALSRRIITSILGSLSILSVVLSLSSLLFISLSPSPSNSLLGLFLEYALATFALTPAVANLILVFVWRAASDPQETLHGRCHWDVDVSWTGTGSQCAHGPGFGVFIAAASARLALTLLFLIMYLIASHVFRWTPRSAPPEFSFRPSRKSVVSQSSNPPLDSRSQLLLARNSAGAPSPTVAIARPSPRNLLDDEFPGEPLAPRPDSAGQSMVYADPLPSPISYPPVPNSTPSTSFSSSTTTAAAASATTGEDDEARLRRRTADMELIQFAAQFRSLVHQMQQDVAAGALSGDDSTPGSDVDGITPLTEGEDDYGFPVQAVTAQAAFEAHLARTAAPPEDRERMRVMLGRLIRRMPTIESLGSREATSVHRMPATASRPATRLTMRSDGASMSSAAPSRSNSLTLGRAVQGSAYTHPLPTPPTPVSTDGSYFSPISGRASPSPLSTHPSRVPGAPCPSRPPTPRTPSPDVTPLASSRASSP